MQMSKTKGNIFYSYLLLLIFTGGQVNVFTHHHKEKQTCKLFSSKHSRNEYHLHKSETEKCLRCTFIIHKTFYLSGFTGVTVPFIPSDTTVLYETANYFH